MRSSFALKMKGFAYTDAELTGILPSNLSAFDRHYWLIETRGGWHPSCASASPQDYEDLDEVLGRSLLQGTSCSWGIPLVDLGGFSKVADCIGLDEWTYLLAIPGNPQNLEDALGDDRLKDFLSEAFFEALVRHGATLIAYIDGWWECFPDSSPLLDGLGVGLQRSETTSQKWASFTRDHRSPVHPEFPGEQAGSSNGG